MDFQLTDEQTLLRDTTRDLLSRSYDPESRNKVIGSDLGWSREVWSQLADTGILGLGFDPEEAGQIEIMVVLDRGRAPVGARTGPARRAGAGCADRRTGHRRAEELLDDVAAGQRLLAFAHRGAGPRASRPRPSRLRLCGKVIRGR